MIIIILIKGQDYEEEEEIIIYDEYDGYDEYEELISEKISEDYCNHVIGNLTSIIEEVYIYSDFIKVPKQPAGYDNYIPKVDLIKELKSINKKIEHFMNFIEI